jgi:hypothetical protein
MKKRSKTASVSKVGKLISIERKMVAIIENTPTNRNFLDNPAYKALDRKRDKILGIK